MLTICVVGFVCGGRCIEGGDCLSDDGGFGGIFLYENITDG